MNIYLEGNEANFKTTVANKLSKKLGWEVLKGSSFELSKKSNEELYQYFLDLANKKYKIIDRFIYSNLTYADLYEDFSIINNEQKRIVEGKLVDSNSLVVYLYAPTNVLERRVFERGDDYVNPDRLGEINQKFEEVINKASVSVFSLNTNTLNSDEIVDMIIKIM